MIEFVSMGFGYDEAPDLIRDLSLTIDAGSFVLVTGATGSGKSTLLATINGLAPHATGGRLDGEVLIDGRSIRQRRPRDLAEVVGYVGQDPARGFVTARVESELAFGMEQRGIAPALMRHRVEEVLDLVGLTELRDRGLHTLSLGQQQRVALGAVLTAAPGILVLDEPTSALDPVGADEVMATLSRLVDDLGLTVVLAEHRVERVLRHVDLVLHLRDGEVRAGKPAEILLGTCSAPPLLRLGRAAGWDPAPVTVRAARRPAALLVERLGGGAPAPGPVPEGVPVLTARRLAVRYGERVAVDGVNLVLRPGEVTAITGRNGSGKSSLLWGLVGGVPRSGRVEVDGRDPASLSPDRARSLVGLVPQDVSGMLFRETVAEECAGADEDADVPRGTTSTILDGLVDGIDRHAHPRDLSAGQRLALALAIVLAAPSRVLLLDEPTRGLDQDAKAGLVRALRELALAGRAVVVATHDVELVAELADRVLLMAQGEIVADGPARQMLTGSLGFAPQLAQVFAPVPWMRLSDVPFPGVGP